MHLGSVSSYETRLEQWKKKGKTGKPRLKSEKPCHAGLLPGCDVPGRGAEGKDAGIPEAV